MRLDVLLSANSSRYEGLGKRLNQARIVFLDRFISWPRNIRDWQCWDEVQHYVENPAAYWKQYNRHHPFLGENCFDPNTGDKPRGYRYHDNFCKLGLDSGYADKIEFIELLSAPVTGSIDYEGEGYDSDVAVFHRLMDNPEHQKLISDLLFHTDEQVVFVSNNVYNLLRYRQQEAFGLDSDCLTTPFPNDPWVFRIMYQHNNSYVISCQDFASIDNEAYYPCYRRLIDAIIYNHAMVWELIFPDTKEKITLESGFKNLLEGIIANGYRLDSLKGISINPLREALTKEYQLPALDEFFSNMDVDYSIHCLLHDIASLETKEKCLPSIKRYYQSIRHLFEPENQILIEKYLGDCSLKLISRDNSLPANADAIREVFYDFCFRNLKYLQAIPQGGIFYAEKELINTIWNTVLDNLYRHGSGAKAIIEEIPHKRAKLLEIRVSDPDSEFDINGFIVAAKAVCTYSKMGKFGELTIESGTQKWSSKRPMSSLQSDKNIQGNIIYLKFVLQEGNHA